jgi:MtN3 and saliva related transmembrane protein
MNEWIANSIGVAAALCSITSFIPQVLKIAKERDASSVSLRTYALTVTCFVLWTIYGVMTEAWPITFANSAALCLSSAVLFMKWRFRNGDPKVAPDDGRG